MIVIVVKIGEPVMNYFDCTNIAYSDGTYTLTTSDSSTYTFSSSDYKLIIS